jgi:oligopeptide/dipeptide ABC transporter ATP-binding protein
MNEIISIKNLKVYFDVKSGFVKDFLSKEKKKVKAVDGLDLDIYKGEIVSLVGESGSGKTTVGKAILKLVEKTDGKILFEGKEIDNKKDIKEFRQRAQMIFQDPYQSLNPKNIISDIVSEPLEVNGLISSIEDRDKKVVESLEWSGLTPASEYLSRYPHELSGGQRQRVAIAGSMILNPEFIIADEPVSMLDVSVRAGILKLMLDLKEKKGVSYLFITHDLSLAWAISDRVAIMYLGKIVELGDANLIIGACSHPYTKALVSVMPLPKVDKNKKRIILKGETPNPANIPSGCRFHPRCPIAQDICRNEEPSLKEISDNHFVACHFPS